PDVGLRLGDDREVRRNRGRVDRQRRRPGDRRAAGVGRGERLRPGRGRGLGEDVHAVVAGGERVVRRHGRGGIRTGRVDRSAGARDGVVGGVEWDDREGGGAAGGGGRGGDDEEGGGDGGRARAARGEAVVEAFEAGPERRPERASRE